jgi:hypothetical protein
VISSVMPVAGLTRSLLASSPQPHRRVGRDGVHSRIAPHRLAGDWRMNEPIERVVILGTAGWAGVSQFPDESQLLLDFQRARRSAPEAIAGAPLWSDSHRKGDQMFAGVAAQQREMVRTLPTLYDDLRHLHSGEAEAFPRDGRAGL